LFDSMPSCYPHLTILSPSPTTVSFTVSTCPPRQSFAAHCTHWFLLGTRALIALVTLLFLASKYFQFESLLSVYISEKIEILPWSYVGTSSAVILFFTSRRFHFGRSCFLGTSMIFTSLHVTTLLIQSCRGISPYVTNARHSNQQRCPLLSAASYYSIHSNVADSRHLCPRGFSGLRS